MTAYATRTDLQRMGVRAGALTGASTDEQDQHLDAASRWADTFLRARYALPLTGTPDPALVEAVCARAAWTYLRANGFDAANASEVAIRDGAKEAEDMLKAVSESKRHLDIPETESDSFIAYQGGPEILSDDPRGW